MPIILPRRRFLAVAVGLIAAPAVVKATSLMKIAMPKPTTVGRFFPVMDPSYIGTERIKYIYRVVCPDEFWRFAKITYPSIPTDATANG
jgi:hypothetical protein